LPHEVPFGVWQVPEPLHMPPGVSVEPLQLSEEHEMPAAYLRQAPAPSQVPSVPQVVVAC
jgi:hypothetical protein